jgi:hypothetical protein
LNLDKFFFTKTLTRITPHIESKRKYEQNTKMHTWIYESQNPTLGGIIIKRRRTRKRNKKKRRKKKIMVL